MSNWLQKIGAIPWGLLATLSHVKLSFLKQHIAGVQ